MNNLSVRVCARWFRAAPFFFLLLLSLGLMVSCQRSETIVHRLDEKEANEIIVFLAGKDIQAKKQQSVEAVGGGAQTEIFWDVTVPRSQMAKALAILNANGLPRRRGQSLLGLFKAGGLVPSELEEKIRHQAGLAEQLADTIRKIDGIIDADVRLSFPEEDPFNPQAEKPKVSASVYVKHQGILDDPNSHLVTKIKRLVSSSIHDLNYDDVTVIGDRARFSDISRSRGVILPEKQEYVKIWSIVVAKESATRFRVIFFLFSIIQLSIVVAIVWVIWKTSPLIIQSGGFSGLFNLHPLTLRPVEEVEEAEAEAEEEAEEEAEGEEGAEEAVEEKEEPEGEEPPPEDTLRE